MVRALVLYASGSRFKSSAGYQHTPHGAITTGVDMNRTEIKQRAQDELMSAMQCAFDQVADTESDDQAILQEMEKQMVVLKHNIWHV